MNERVWSVGKLIDEVNTLMEAGFSGITVEGEIGGVSRSARGHLYFSLKEGDAQLDCVAWSSTARRLRFDLEEGLAVEAGGSLTVYKARGRLQLVVSRIAPQGLGALQLAFEQMKRRLEAEGLFDPARKRDLPMVPQRVGIVTSASGAALRDMLKVFRRHSNVEVLVAPATVQGRSAASEIADAVTRLGASGRADVIIVGRGGGSLEDLWAFNEEPVARAIAGCPVPVVSAVGHEVDFTIADFTADVRAATPTHAAEMIVGQLDEIEARVADGPARLGWELRRHLQVARNRLAAARGSAGLARVPHRVEVARMRLAASERLPGLLTDLLRRTWIRWHQARAVLRRLPGAVAAGGHRRLLDSRKAQLESLMRAQTARSRAGVDARERALQHLSPRRVFERGYSMTTLEGDSTPLKEATGLQSGQTLVTTLARGSVRSLVAAARSTRERPAPQEDDSQQGLLFEDGGST